MQLVVHLVRVLVTLLEGGMVRADEGHPKVHLSEADVDMEHILLGAARDADWSPCLSVLHGWVRHDEVENHLDV